MNAKLLKNTEDAKECSNCREIIETDEEYAIQEDETILCYRCYSHQYPKCEFCGERIPEDDMKFWGDCYCCPECYEGFNPSFDEEKNEKETTEAYEAMLKRYMGRKARFVRDDSVDLELETSDCGLVNYKMTVDIDEDGVIYDISRLTAEILLSESERSSDWGSYIIRNEDYKDKVDEMMLDLDLE